MTTTWRWSLLISGSKLLHDLTALAEHAPNGRYTAITHLEKVLEPGYGRYTAITHFEKVLELGHGRYTAITHLEKVLELGHGRVAAMTCDSDLPADRHDRSLSRDTGRSRGHGLLVGSARSAG